MLQLDPQQGLMPSLLDRLIDPNAEGTSGRHGYTVEQMIAAVHRDLEELLNTRQVLHDLPPECVELSRSIVAYGMPDLTNIEAVTSDQRARIGRILETLVERYEPRLRHVRATLLEPDQALRRAVKFHLEAQLAVDPAPEVRFETILELTTGHSSITRADLTS